MATGTPIARPEGSAPDSRLVVEEMESRQRSLLAQCRKLIGVNGQPGEAPGLAATLGEGAGWNPILVLTGFAALIQASIYAVSLLGPEMGRSMGLSAAVVGIIIAQQNQGVMLGSAQLSYLVHRNPGRRRSTIIGMAFTCGLVLVESAFITQPVVLALDLGALGAALGSIYALQRPMLMDAYPATARVRAMSFHASGSALGAIVAAIIFGVVEGLLGLTWRSGFLILGGLVIVIVLVAARLLPDVALGTYDTDRIRAAVRRDAGSTLPPTTGDDPQLGFPEILKRMWAVPTVRRLLVSWAVVGVVVTPLVTYEQFYVQEQWHMGVGARVAFFAGCWTFAIPGLVLFARRGERAFGESPAKLIEMGAVVMAVMAFGLVAAIAVPFMALGLIAFGLVFAGSAVLIPILTVPMLSMVRPFMRPHTAAVAAFFMAGAGAEVGSFILGGIEARFSVRIAIACTAVPALIGVVLLRSATAMVNSDVDALVNEIIEQEQVTDLVARGTQLPLLTCRHIDYAYGSLQVLFDVNFTVEEGEMVALLGTNGAGKSTLLRAISGLGSPSRGSVTFAGQELTYWDSERRVAQGIIQVPGGRAVFAGLTVVENLRVFAYTHGRDRKAVDAGVERTFEVFPALSVLRNNLANTLSGGEQQMLGLGKAFMLEPKLLLIDELSLGLAPKIVGQLLEIVRQINERGTAVVLVEQSVNIALSVVHRAYFMDRGTIMFEGSAAALLDRPDLLRAAYLEGAARELA